LTNAAYQADLAYINHPGSGDATRLQFNIVMAIFSFPSHIQALSNLIAFVPHLLNMVAEVLPSASTPITAACSKFSLSHSRLRQALIIDSTQAQKITPAAPDKQAADQAEFDDYITAQAQAVAPEPLRTVEISFSDHEYYAGN
jgi:hypothetical protein